MARSLSNLIFKGIASYPSARSSRIVSGSLYRNGMKYSTDVPNDPDTHEDFRPTSKVDASGLSLKEVVEQDVKENPVMLYMKGVPEFPQCGFSSLAVRVLGAYSKFSYFCSLDSELFQLFYMLVKLIVVSVLIDINRDVPISARNILEDPELKSAVKAFSHWPTFPQIFIKGEFIGGSDIILNMHQSGELKEKLKGIASNQKSD
ncbi:Monothiol glutaredoxin-S15 [Citrus sinensis]|nr:Monothiol glutaredoxin-S15 [Citrus sinensis]